MKNRAFQKQTESEEVLAQFGEAKLLRINDKVLLRGGSMADRIEALEWLAISMPEEAAAVER